MEKKRKNRERERERKEMIKRGDFLAVSAEECTLIKKKEIIDWDGIPIRIPQSVIKMPSSFIAFRPL